MASAQLYWGRLAALLLRLLYHLFPEVDWGFVFVDDFCWLLRTTDAPRLTAALLATLLALGTPLSWKKTFVGETNTWLGFVVNPQEPSVMMARSKHLTVMALLTRLHEGHTFSSKEVEQALGRIQWATTCFPMTKVFLQPFWAWKVACKTAGRPPKVVRLLAKLLLFLFRCPNRQLSPYSTCTAWWGCSDASASKGGIVYVGGWLTDSRDPTKDSVYWFHTQVVAADVPWLFGSPDARRRIAAFELLGTYLLCSCLMDKCEPSTTPRTIPLASDNQGNVFSLLNQSSKQPLTALITMELLVSLHDRGFHIAPTHVKRDLNEWADELTHPDYVGFSADRELPVRHLFKQFKIIPHLLVETHP